MNCHRIPDHGEGVLSWWGHLGRTAHHANIACYQSQDGKYSPLADAKIS